MKFTGKQAIAVAHGFAQAIAESNYRILACSILPQHVHVVIDRQQRSAERIIAHLKTRAAQQLIAEQLHPFSHMKSITGRFPSVWAHRSWNVFLESSADITRAIDYVNNNPLKSGHKPQHWSFIHPV